MHANILGNAPLVEAQSSHMLQVMQLLSTTKDGQETCTKIAS